MGGTYHTATDVAACSLSGNWTLVAWSAGLSAGNPGIGEVQIVASGYSTSDIVEIGYNQKGYIFGRVSDDNGTNWDSVGVAVDLYDSVYHLAVLQSIATTGPKDSLRLFVDHRAPATIAFTNASSVVPIDTVQIFARRAASAFVGLIDEVYIIEDTTTFDSQMRDFVPGGLTAAATSWTLDSALGVLRGIDPDDSTSTDTSLSAPKDRAVGINDSLLLYERAYLDTCESQPILVFSNANSPRSSKLDSIPANKYHVPRAVIVVPRREKITIERIKVGVLDASHLDIITFEARGYPEYEDALGAGGSNGAVVYGRRVVDSTIGPSKSFIEGPFTLQGPATFEVWAKAAAGSSLGFVEIYGKKGKQH